MSVYSDMKFARDDEEREYLEAIAEREARRDEYLYEESLREYDECDDEYDE